MQLNPLTAISPIDGRYSDKTARLRPLCSEYGLFYFRVLIEIRWLQTLADQPNLKEIPKFSPSSQQKLNAIIENFSVKDAERIKTLEKTTRHDIKAVEYFLKEKEVREDNHIPPTDPVLFLEVQVSDASEFIDTIVVKGIEVGGYRILCARSSAVPNAIAALLLYIRDQSGKIPHAYFGWVEGNPIQYLLRFILFGEGDIAVVTREVLRKAERDPKRRPGIHVGG